MDEIQEKAKKDSFYIALGYVGLGIISLLAITSKTLMENDFTCILFILADLLTIPATFIGFGILWGGGENGRTVMLIVQLGVFVIFWYGTYRYLVNRYRSKELKKRRAPDRDTDAQ